MKRTTIMVDQHKLTPPENPLLSIVGLGASEEFMDLSDGGDEALLSVEYHRQWQNTLERGITTVPISTDEIMALTREDVHLITP